ncbi:acyl transferase/acyl hydrolase/lysophospholipase [Obelidium mucronatum]|nr:acyl transferase/acyl hydrolase/lysophospholipase [Obelidium mucronatum]
MSLFFTLLRYPILVIILSIMGLDLTALLLVRLFVFLYETFVVSQGPHRKLLALLSLSDTYAQWKIGASYLDSFMKHDEWKKQEDQNEIYNSKLIRKTTRKLRSARFFESVPGGGGGGGGDPKEVMRHLTHACKKNHGGCMNEALYSNTYHGTKLDVEAFYQELEESIEFVASSPALKLDQKLSFFKSLSRNYGRAALSLSGGGSLTYYHMGVLKSLFEEGMLPNVITGTSGGSMLAALVCTRTDEELASEGVFDADRVVDKFKIMSDPWAVRIKRLLSEGYLFDPTEPFKKLGELTKGHLTFLEAYKKTGRILCISVVPDEPNHVTPAKVLNFMTAPDVLISSAICASCAIPLILPPIKLLCKTEAGDFVPYRGSGKLWRDGSIRSDIPDLSMLNVTFQIVSQVNPHITIFFYESQGSAGCPTPHRGGRGWRGGFIASSLIHMIDLDLKKWLRLCKDLKLLPPIMATDISSVFLQQFDGTVTILPANSNVLPDCVHILEDPSVQQLKEYVLQGQLKAFPKLGMIGHRMRIEKCIQRVRDRLLVGGGGGGGGGIKRSVTRFSTTDLDD